MNTETGSDTGTSAYVFDNAAVQQTETRFTALPQLFDSSTTRHLATLGVGAGWSCLEVGAGGGSIARWLAARVGPGGRVVATDIDPRFLHSIDQPPIEVLQHDITSDPLPEASFDLVHTRLVLSHIPERATALARMIGALKPGGWLLVEEFDSLSMLPDSTINAVEELLPIHQAMYRVMTARGVDLRFGRLLPGRLKALGLTNIDAEGRVLLWQGGSPGSRLMRANFEQLRDGIIATTGMTSLEFDAELARFNDPAIMNPSPVLWSVMGRRP